MDILSYKELKALAPAQQAEMVNKAIKETSKKEVCEVLGIKENSLNSHMKKLGYHSPKANHGLYTINDSKMIGNDKDESINFSDNLGNNNNNLSNSNNEIDKANDDLINSNNTNSNNNDNLGNDKGVKSVSNDKINWENMSQKELLRARKDAFAAVVDELEAVDLDKTVKTSFSIYADAAEMLDLFSKTFKQSKQDVVSAAIMQFVKQFNDTNK